MPAGSPSVIWADQADVFGYFGAGGFGQFGVLDMAVVIAWEEDMAPVSKCQGREWEDKE